jgi:hypothetical protein
MRISSLAVAFAGAALCAAIEAWAQGSVGGWIADPGTNCRVQDPSPIANESIKWSGPCRNGLAEGRGTLQWFLKGQPTERTEGEWHGGKLNGRALTVFADGRRHEGEYREGVPDGRGVTTLTDGSRLDSTYRAGKANGRGVFTKTDGSKLDAEFVDDQATRGTWIWKNGNRYEGDLKNFQPDGQGVYLEPNGGHYKGEFVAGRIEGLGVMNFANRDVYNGAWRNMMPNGQGTFRSGKNGSVFSGLWIDGCLSQANSANGQWATINKSAAACGFQ